MTSRRTTGNSRIKHRIEKSRILILDNESDTGDVLINFLQRSGYDAISVTDLRSMKSVINKFKPDLVIVDLDPGLPNYASQNLSLARNLSSAGIPSIHLVGDPRAVVLEDSKTPFRRCVAKPIDGGKLLRLVKQGIAK
mgnify:CR=1 FL=1